MMRNFLIFLTFSAVFSLPIEENIEPKEAKEAEKKIEDDEAARNARFNFGYSIQDEINGATVQRTEERDGLALKGEYTYSDGFFKRTVHYEADENGYRVTKMLSEPIGNGPVQNKLGKAIVQMLVSGVETEYAIQAQPLTEEESAEEEISGFEPASALAADVIVDKN